MKMVNNPKIIVTLGPATNSREILHKIKDRGVDFVRVNLSHSPIKELKYFIGLAKEVGLPFILDTEGSQIRTGDFGQDLNVEENQPIKIFGAEKIKSSTGAVCLKPTWIIKKLAVGDLLHVDFHSAILRIADTSTIKKGYITAKAITAGVIGKNKAVVADPASPSEYALPTLTSKDYEAIKIGLKEGIKHIAVSFVRKPEDIELVRKATQNKMQIISKIECVDALKNLDPIIKKTDWLLIDRGDLSKEIPIEKIPLAQDLILKKAQLAGKPVLVATNLLETMIDKPQPTRAEIHDIVSTIQKGAAGLALAGETAIGKYPVEAINRLKKIIAHATAPKIDTNYLIDDTPLLAVPAHGGKLVNRVLAEKPDPAYLKKLKKFKVDENRQMDAEQISLGVFSPLEGFMGQKDLTSVLDKMRLANGVIWTLPVILDGSKEETAQFKIGEEIALTDQHDQPFAILNLEEKYHFDKDQLVKKLYGTDNTEHPGVRMVQAMRPVFLGGKVDLIKRRNTEIKEYELTPRQVRRLFEERGWLKVVGFHTRNVIHKGHEFVQMEALRQGHSDGLLVHPIVGKKKAGDFQARYIVQAYEEMGRNFYPKNKVVFSVFSSYSRYAGPREAVFTAICRKNYGCSHFIVGRDHTGVGNFYPPTASHDIFDKFPDLGIKIIKFNNVFYSKKLKRHIHENQDSRQAEKDKLHISGTQVRKMFQNGKMPPAWFMRPEISKIILTAIKKGEEVFVPEQKTNRGNSAIHLPENSRARSRGSKVGRIADLPPRDCKVIWFTGLSGSGKSTIALALQKKLEDSGKKVLILDGDAVRKSTSQDLGFSRADNRENNQRIAELAKSKAEAYDFILVPIIPPYREDRARAKSIIGQSFIELYINSPFEVCEKRDVKGLYHKFRNGQLGLLIGASSQSPYQPPRSPEIEVQTDRQTVKATVNQVLEYLNQHEA